MTSLPGTGHRRRIYLLRHGAVEYRTLPMEIEPELSPADRHRADPLACAERLDEATNTVWCRVRGSGHSAKCRQS